MTKSIKGGILAAAVTPRRSRELSIDLAAALELMDFLYEGGVDGISLLGSTGEFVHFMLEDRARMLDFAVKRSRLPVLVNISHSTQDGAIFLGQEAISSGVAALLLMPPYYFSYSQETVRAFCLQVGEELAKEVPVYLYNAPPYCSQLSVETASDLLASGIFTGIKDSSGDYEFTKELLGRRAGRSFEIYAGDGKMYSRLRAAGADGAISDVACAIPDLVVRLDRAIMAGEQDLIVRLDARLQEFNDNIKPFTAPAGIKTALAQRKMSTGALATPLGTKGQRELAAFGGWFKDWLPGVLKECR